MRLNLWGRHARRIGNPVILLSLVVALLGVDVHARQRSEPGRGQSEATTTAPDCMAGKQKLEIDNANVLNWKATSRDQFKGRARIKGTITKVYANTRSHTKLQATIGPSAGDTVEIVYNDSFGRIPRLPLNAAIEVCGDYITARKPFRRYPASPDGALIHWVHRSNDSGHPHGYVIIDGTVYGY